MPYFNYPCSDCHATTSFHDADCRFEEAPWAEVEWAYIGIISVLASSLCNEEILRHETPGEWGPLQQAALRRLKRGKWVSDANSGVPRPRTVERFRKEVPKPTWKPMQTLHQYGSVSGCHNNAVFAMIAWYEVVGLSWPETRENVANWPRDTGAQDHGGFEEVMPAEPVEKKRHVYEADYDWKKRAVSTKRVINHYRS